jgi:protein-S-isoprenylcysteine O-methyltransferase Ste14
VGAPRDRRSRLAYTAVLVAMPSVWAWIGWTAGVIWLVRGALHDERTILDGALGAAYAEYKKRTGMFLPPLRTSRAT